MLFNRIAKKNKANKKVNLSSKNKMKNGVILE